jgi:hypothetical protein
MAWPVELSRDAERDLGRFPRDVTDRVVRESPTTGACDKGQAADYGTTSNAVVPLIR